MDNPQAFQEITIYAENGKLTKIQKGMTLRDYFAGKAMSNLCISTLNIENFKLIAKYSYQFADAMLKEREKKS